MTGKPATRSRGGAVSHGVLLGKMFGEAGQLAAPVHEKSAILEPQALTRKKMVKKSQAVIRLGLYRKGYSLQEIEKPPGNNGRTAATSLSQRVPP